MRYLFALLLGLWVSGLPAMPLTFTSSQSQTDAFAQVGAVMDTPPSDSNPPSSFPLLTTASAISGADQADAGGTVDDGFLGASAEVTSVTQDASALASAEFTGDFVASGGPLLLTLDFDSQLPVLSNGLAENSLLVRLIGNGVTLLQETFSATELITRVVVLPAGLTQGTLDLLLTSSAEATADTTVGRALGLATVSFTADIPEPSVGLLLLPGLALLALWQRRLRTPDG